MRHNDDLDGLPIVSRGNPAANFVAPTQQTQLARREPATIDVQPLTTLAQAQPVDVSHAWQPLQAAQERTCAVDRAEAVQKRLQPFLWLYGAAALVVGGTIFIVAGSVPGAALGAVLVFAALGAGTYVKLNVLDYSHSGAGVERLRITEAADLQREAMRNDHELRRMALETYLTTLEKHAR